jgi:5-methylcytosine-specific restriction endonuclease McrA
MSAKRQIRLAFRTAVLNRDRYRCAICGAPGKDRQGGDSHEAFHCARVDLADLDAHHVTDRNEMPHGGYVAENGISLCAACHLRAEVFHDTGTAHPGFSPDELYAKIDSSLEKARHASLKL